MVTKAKAAPQTEMTLNGNEAVAWGARLARVSITGFLPIGPADEVGNTMGDFYTSGSLKGMILDLEAEDIIFAAMSAAARSGSRAMFATTSQGVTKGLPCITSMGFSHIPLLLPMPHRAIGGGGIWPDWGDMVVCRDLCWIIISAETPQEILDLVPQVYKVAEDPTVLLPVILGYEGWEISHASERCLVPTQEDIDKFLPPYRGPSLASVFEKTDWRETMSERLGPVHGFPMPPGEGRYATIKALDRAKELLKQVDEEYGKLFGRRWGGVLDDSLCKNAEVVFLTMGAACGACRVAAEAATALGIPTGVLKLRLFNPFPNEEVRKALKGCKVVIAVDRDESAVLYHNVRSALFNMDPKPKVLGRIEGLAGVCATIEELVTMAEDGARAARGEDVIELGWLLKGTRKGQHIVAHPF